MTAFQRIHLRLEFEGAAFCGWQLQHSAVEGVGAHPPSVQGLLERALQTLFREKNERFIVNGCGRTDAGVHARDYHCHVDIADHYGRRDLEGLEKLRHSLNCILPPQIVVTSLRERSDNFHAQRDVVAKTYEYCVLLRRAKAVLDGGRVWWLPILAEEPFFSIKKLNEGLEVLTGRHDFRAFMAAHSDVTSSVRTLWAAKAELVALGDEVSAGHRLTLRFRGDGFLKHQVRNMVGMLLDVAQSLREVDDLRFLLGENGKDPPQDRTKSGYCAPPEGLYLVSVEYP